MQRDFLADRRNLMRLGGVAVLVTLTFLLLRPVSDFDVWFARLAGRYVIDHGAVPRHEFYLYPVLGEPSQFSAWGFGLLLELVARGLGEPGVAVVNALLGAATLLLLLLAGRVRGTAPLWMSLAALSVAYVGLDLRLNYRPEATLYVALAASLLLLEKFVVSRRPVFLWPLPLFAWLLAQFHTTSIFIFLLLVPYLVEWVFDSRPPRLRMAAGLAMIALATLLLPVLNPYGWQRLVLILPSLQAGAPGVPGVPPPVLVEYLPVLQTEYAPYFHGFLVLAAACLVAGPRRLAPSLVLAGLTALSFVYARNIALFAIGLYLPLVFALGRIGFRVRRPALLGGALVVLMWSGAVTLALRMHPWGWGLASGVFPEQGAARIAQLAPGGRIANFFHLGSFLAWKLGPRYLVLVDGHLTHVSRADALHDAIFRADPGWREQLAGDGVDFVATPATLPYSGALIPLVAQLADDGDWSLVAAEPRALLFARRSLLAARPEIAVLPAARVWQQVVSETDDVLRLYPAHEQAQQARALAHARLGDPAAAAGSLPGTQ